MKSIGAWTAALVCFATLVTAGRAEKVASIPAPAGYVDDYAGVISAPKKAQLESLCRELHEKTRAQVFLVTVKSLDGETVETFANELFAKWKIGEKKTDRGALIFLATTDHKRWIEVGYGLEGILNDAKVGDVGRAMVPPLRSGNYDEAAQIGIDDLSRVIATDAGVSLSGIESGNVAPAPAVAPGAPNASNPCNTGCNSVPSMFPALLFAMVTPVIVLIMIGFAIWWIWKNRVTQASPGAAASIGPDSRFIGDSATTFSNDAASDTSSNVSASDTFSGGDGGSSGGAGAGGDW